MADLIEKILELSGAFEDSSDGSVVTQDTLMKKIDPCGSALFHGGDKR